MPKAGGSFSTMALAGLPEGTHFPTPCHAVLQRGFQRYAITVSPRGPGLPLLERDGHLIYLPGLLSGFNERTLLGLTRGRPAPRDQAGCTRKKADLLPENETCSLESGAQHPSPAMPLPARLRTRASQAF